LRAFENRVLRRIFGTEREDVAGGWRTLHEEGLHNLYASPSIVRVIKSMSCIVFDTSTMRFLRELVTIQMKTAQVLRTRNVSRHICLHDSQSKKCTHQ
jgi:hypothetical protein